MDKLTTIPQKGLTITEIQAITELPKGLQKFVIAKDSEIISKLSPLDAELYLVDFVAETLLNIGHTKKAEDGITNEQTAIAVKDLIFERYTTLTKSELKLAVLSYFIDSDIEYTGVNVKSVSAAIRAYYNCELKKKAMSEWNKAIDQVSIKEKTPEQKEAIIRDGCLHHFEDYKANVLIIPVDHLCGVFYVYLKEKGLINFSPEKRIELYDKAKAEYLSGLNKFQAQIGKDIYGSILQSMSAKKDEPQNRSFGNMCKRYALLEYFDFLISNNKHLKELLK